MHTFSGIPMNVRVSILSEFNSKFQENLKNMSINESYAKIVKEQPYRILSSFDLEGKAHRSQRVAVLPSDTDVRFLYMN